MFDENPSLIQDPDIDVSRPAWAIHDSRPPLVLIHDGGGTTFNYHLLGPLGRRVYGITNPHFHSGAPWPGGIPEMARTYARLIHQELGSGPVILGGWSQGGVVSVELTAAVLADGEAALDVMGIVMIDSVNPRRRAVWDQAVASSASPAAASPPDSTVSSPAAGAAGASVPHPPPPATRSVWQNAAEWGSTTRPETRAAVLRCFTEGGRISAMWTLPVWEASAEEAAAAVSAAKGAEDWVSSVATTTTQAPPPIVLLRAREIVPAPPGSFQIVDSYRQDRYLGWHEYRKEFIAQVLDIPGHHFNIFAFPHLDEITKNLKMACFRIETLAAQRKRAGIHDRP